MWANHGKPWLPSTYHLGVDSSSPGHQRLHLPESIHGFLRGKKNICCDVQTFCWICSVVDLSIYIYIYIWYYLLKRNKIEHLDTSRVTLEFLNKCLMMWQKRKTKLSRPILEQWIPHQWQLKGTIWRFKLPPHLTTPLTWYESLNHVTFRI